MAHKVEQVEHWFSDLINVLGVLALLALLIGGLVLLAKHPVP